MVLDRRRGEEPERFAWHSHQIVVHAGARLVHDRAGFAQVRANYAVALYNDPDATLDDLREAVTTLEEIGRIARRVFGGAYPLVVELEDQVQEARAALRARETLGTV